MKTKWIAPVFFLMNSFMLFSQNMDKKMNEISNFNDLVSAVNNGQNEIIVTRSITCNYPLFLKEGTTLRGEKQENGEYPLLSFQHSDGVGLAANNSVKDLNIHVPSSHKAVFNTMVKPDLGILSIENVFAQGQVSVIARAGVEKANVVIDQLDIINADSRHYLEQPQKYGVNVLQGALTVYNLNSDSASLVDVRITDVKIGRKNAPVSGSGIFIAGFGDQGGKVHVSKLTTGAVYATGKIPFGVADYIAGGVFILNGAHAEEVTTNGEVVTYGVNDMVLDVWGSVVDWTSNAPVISYGPSGVGFVNFGIVRNFTVNAPLQTYGQGARGYNQYDGTVDNITFQSIETFGDGSVGIQISKKIGTLTVKGDVITHGSVGISLVKGVNVELPAYAFSMKEGGVVESVTIEGNLKSFGDGVTTFISEKGSTIKHIRIDGNIEAAGHNSVRQLLNHNR